MDLYRKHVQLEIYRQVLYVIHEKGLNYFSEDIPNCLFLTTIKIFKKREKRLFKLSSFLRTSHVCTHARTHTTSGKGKLLG